MFREELEKILTNGVFYAAIVSAVILLMLGYIYKSPYTGEEHTVLGMMFNDDREALIKEGFTVVDMQRRKDWWSIVCK